MARRIAPTDPRTLAAAFNDQAHLTYKGDRISSRRSPVGKGIPMAKPAGATMSTLRTTFDQNGQPIVVLKSQARLKAITATSALTEINNSTRRPSDRAKRRLLK